MKYFLTILLITSVCFLNFTVNAQKTKLYLEMNKPYAKGKIYIKKSLVPIAVSQLNLINDSTLTYTESETGVSKSLNVTTSSVNYIKLKTGTKAGSFALWGGAFMGLCALSGALSAEADYLDDYGESSGYNYFPLVFGFTAGGALTGALIGVFYPKYKNFYIKDKAVSYSFGLSPYYYKGVGASIGMRMTF